VPGFIPLLLAGGCFCPATSRHVAGRAARGRPKAGAQQPAVDLSCRAGARTFRLRVSGGDGRAEAKSLDKRPATGRWRTNMGRRVDGRCCGEAVCDAEGAE
jgi:hypothetical protein